ncbi:glycolate oxidase subunit GlcE [Kaustia mangrovi]|uniref:Glycolate oxidase subunit GlcE n=1 Tax=Kaustia mangrovi TaxID=2593653 RepID=A0A7S8C1E1_9HYPH|nr:glycolate oxidase subunit GlcE [Kaustia mangrovi]QPC41589.1 glycolate oxidase subunit GlcE [Kaustia mangrovi]
MADIHKPDSVEALRDLVAGAASEDRPLAVRGHGTRDTVGRPVQAAATLDLSGLSGITLYEPEELVLGARAGTPRGEVEEALAGNGQEFAFEPPDLGTLLGSQGRGTLGGMIACNLSGPRRVKAGAVRDHFLGFTGVSGRGEVFKAGGRVVKNVTGYDLPKLMAGSWGTLVAMSDVIVKVLPRAQTQSTLALMGLDDATAIRAMSLALQSPYEVSGAAHIPADVLARSNGTQEAEATAVTALRLEGVGPSVDYRAGELGALLGEFGTPERLPEDASRGFWREVRDVLFLAGSDDAVWRISVPPMEGAEVAARIRARAPALCYYDWAGGLVWCAVPPAGDAHASAVRGALLGTTGHATLIRAPQEVRAAVPVFEPPSPGVAAVSRRVKEAFDPRRVLNPGRMYADL